MIVNENMKPKEDNLLSLTRAYVNPGEAMILPRAFMEINVLPFLKNTEVIIYSLAEIGAAFLEYQLFVHEGGKTKIPIDNGLENFFYVIEGDAEFLIDGKKHRLEAEGYVWLPPGVEFEFENKKAKTARLLWLRKEYVETSFYSVPDPVISSVLDIEKVQQIAEIEQQLVPFERNLGFDIAMNMLTFEPGVTFPRTEAHSFEHGGYFLNGRGIFWINGKYHEVHEDDFGYFAPFVPHFVMANGPTSLRYLLYKNVNRDYPLRGSSFVKDS